MKYYKLISNLNLYYSTYVTKTTQIFQLLNLGKTIYFTSTVYTIDLFSTVPEKHFTWNSKFQICNGCQEMHHSRAVDIIILSSLMTSFNGKNCIYLISILILQRQDFHCFLSSRYTYLFAWDVTNINPIFRLTYSGLYILNCRNNIS